MARFRRTVLGLLVFGVATSSGYARTQSDEILAVRDYRVEHEREIVGELIEFLSLPNVADDVPAMRRNAEMLVGMLERRGVSAMILETGGPPHVFGEARVPGARRTILFYCHFDGQPIDPSRWKGHEPFTPVFRAVPLEAGGTIVELPAEGRLDSDLRVYARSASDDKSPIIALLAALDALEAAGLRPNVNLKFLFEGDEEMGSPNLERVVREHRDLLKADLVVANVNAIVLAQLAQELRRALAPGGPLIAAGILEERRAPVERAFADAGLAVRESFEDGDWLALVLS